MIERFKLIAIESLESKLIGKFKSFQVFQEKRRILFTYSE
jgi:hypothetical protein